MSAKIKSNLLSETKNTEHVLIDVFLDEVININNLVKIDTAIALGPDTEIRRRARRVLTREIYNRIDSLSVNVIEFFKSKDEKTKS